MKSLSLSAVFFLFGLSAVFLFSFFFAHTAYAQSPSPSQVTPSTPFYPLAPCPSCSGPTYSPAPSGSVFVTGSAQYPSGAITNPDPEDPCDAEGAAIAHDRKHKHKKHHGGMSDGMEAIIKLLIELLNKLIELLGGQPIQDPNPDENQNPDNPDQPDEDGEEPNPCPDENEDNNNDNDNNNGGMPEVSTSPAPSIITPSVSISTVPGPSTTAPSAAVLSGTPVAAGKCKTDISGDLGGVPGMSAAIVKNGKVVCTAVAGMADTSQNKPVTPETAFTWASVSKPITGTAAMQLFEQGKFKLDDDISTFIGFKVEIPNCAGKPVTFRQLMTHTSGIKDNNIPYYPQGDSPIVLGEYVKGILTPGSQYYDASGGFTGCPGTVNDYANAGAGTIGVLVEKISGKGFDQYTKDHIFTPLGMKNSSFRYKDIDPNNDAKPDGNQQHQGIATYPDGTFTGPPQELGKFVAAFMNGGNYNGVQLLKPESVQEMLKNQTTLDSAQGLFWYTSSGFDPAGTTWGHNGSDPGVSSEMQFNPTTKTGVMVAANGESGDFKSVMNKLFQEAASY